MDYELVDRYFEAVEEEQALADSTLRTYAYAIRDFCRHLEKLGAASLDEVAKSDVFDYVRDQMDRGISASTINTRLVALKSLFRHLHAYGLIDANPMSKFGPRRPAAHNSTSPRSVDYIISYLNGMPQTTPLGIRNRALAEIIFGSALTVKQLVSLNVDDLSLGRREIISTRQFLSDESCFWLARYLGQVREPLARKRAPEGANVEHDNALFLSRTGRRLLGRDVARALRKSEKGPMTATTLRLSLPFILIAHGMSPLAVNKFMGWSPSRIRLVLEIYDCMNPPEAVRIVQRRLGSSAGDEGAS
ncbi:site-specific integrase [Enterorhabdus sp. P55]|uniref:tyrosine-type recombinase/integrase n=1 Tax=Enterorhabdus sp. P55 TaxID=2304571 RepID=UPI001369A334|nr:site-specific integrase [Enterorhabdus sp. P55]